MYKDFIGKQVEVVVSFSTYTVDGGASPNCFYGVLEDVTDASIKLSLMKVGKGKFNSVAFDGQLMEINKNYVISIMESRID